MAEIGYLLLWVAAGVIVLGLATGVPVVLASALVILGVGIGAVGYWMMADG